MSGNFTRRKLFHVAGAAAGTMMGSRYNWAMQQQPQTPQAKPPRDGNRLLAGHPDPFPPLATRSTVSLVHGENRRKNVYEALMAIDEQIRPKLKRKKYVLIKPNNVSTNNQLAASHADALRGILDYLAPRFKGPVIIAESSAGNTMTGFDNFKYPALTKEYKKVSLLDFNEEAKYVLLPLIDFDIHLAPVRLAARLVDPDAFIFCAACMKTHNMAVVTLSIKNMVLGAPIHQAPKETKRWNDKRRFHVGIRQSLYNMFLTAQRLQPHWGATIIDGYEGMEGNGPGGGTPVPSRVAIASTDYVAADRIGAEVMGVDASWLGWLKYSGEIGLGQWDLDKIDIRGAQIASVQKKYRLHTDIELMLRWRGPMEEMPPNLGWVKPIFEHYPVDV
jgi:uncharacterized protein (DUF362 family)